MIVVPNLFLFLFCFFCTCYMLVQKLRCYLVILVVLLGNKFYCFSKSHLEAKLILWCCCLHEKLKTFWQPLENTFVTTCGFDAEIYNPHGSYNLNVKYVCVNPTNGNQFIVCV